MNKLHPMRGLQVWRSKHQSGALILRVHYSADPAKNPETTEGKKWEEEARAKSPTPEWFEQEQNIDFAARQGARVYPNFKDDASCLVDDFPIPAEWTRHFVLDPHPGARTPHAFLWAAMAPDGQMYCYRELWPSRSYGQSRNVPEDDAVWSIRNYCETIKWLESGADEEVALERMGANGKPEKIIVAGNPENKYGPEKIYRRIIDYAARGFGKDADNPDAMDYQERYQAISAEIGHPLHFEDCIKDNEAAYAEVNEWLAARPTLDRDGEVRNLARVRIFKSCVELRFQLLNNRHQMLQPHQVDLRDPMMKAIQKRNHLTDCLKYLVQAKPYFYKPKARVHTAKPTYQGINW